uniref:Secreted protein n=1 Tax=Globodera pallida TaxID=36090 RepID=A0A183CJW8_GLOPA
MSSSTMPSTATAKSSNKPDQATVWILGLTFVTGAVLKPLTIVQRRCFGSARSVKKWQARLQGIFSVSFKHACKTSSASRLQDIFSVPFKHACKTSSASFKHACKTSSAFYYNFLLEKLTKQ